MNNVIRVGFIGNPNCGKTTLFNAYTGANLKVANWPGVTVEKKEGHTTYQNHTIQLIDLPGIYSLTSYTMEEKVARECILSNDIDIIVDVADASSLERNLYLTLQLIELGKPVILALNMMDIVKERGMEIDLHRLSEMLGIPVIPISARKKNGLSILLHSIVHHHSKLLNGNHISSPGYSEAQINQKYHFIEEILQETLINKTEEKTLTDKIDYYLTHKILGLPIFLGIMALVFFLTFTIGDWMKGYFELFLEFFTGNVTHLLSAFHTSDMIISLVVDGIISGVGGILTFLPNIFILFLALAFLEDSGYMSRVAFIMDDIMGKLGLSGRAFIPLLLGFGCSVPAIMASRALEHRKDRLKTILVTPFMSCSARLPIYVLFSQMFFARHAMLVSYSLYLMGIIIAIATTFILSKFNGSKTDHALLIELPEYKTPSAHTITIYVWEKVKDYLSKAGTVIFAASVIMWLLLNFGPAGYVTDISCSFGSIIGKFAVPIFQPLGLGYWQIIVALIAGIAAKEIVVSSCGVLFGIQNITSNNGMNSLVTTLGALGFGSANAYALMTFCLLYVPCTATIATIHREAGSKKLTFGIVMFQLAVAWVMSFIVYRIGLLF